MQKRQVCEVVRHTPTVRIPLRHPPFWVKLQSIFPPILLTDIHGPRCHQDMRAFRNSLAQNRSIACWYADRKRDGRHDAQDFIAHRIQVR